MATDVSAEFDGAEWIEFRKRLSEKIDQINNPTKLAEVLQPGVFKGIQENFKKESGPDGKWQKWSDVYADHLKRIGRSGNKILQFSGRLRNSFVPSSKEAGYRPQSGGVLFFNNAKVGKKNYPYAAGHDEGDGKLPQRKFMWLSSKASNKIIKDVQDWLNEII